ncbi:MAG TPA: hypothetical protein VGD64_04820, partial [Acidisarcina sp.]
MITVSGFGSVVLEGLSLERHNESEGLSVRSFVSIVGLFFVAAVVMVGQVPASGMKHVTVFFEKSFPAADSAEPTADALRSLFRNASLADVGGLQRQLASGETSLLVLPFGSAFPEAAWPQIFDYLEGGGNLLVIGGQPFTRAAYRVGSEWKLRSANVYFPMQLFIDDYQPTTGSSGGSSFGAGALKFEPNPDTTPALPAFEWKRAFSPVIRLSVNELYRRAGSTGDTDAVLETLAWGTADGHRRAAPVLEIDHDHKRFVGGRWIFVACELADGFFTSDAAKKLLPELATIAVRRGDRFTFRPTVPLFVEGEQPQFTFEIAGEVAAAGTGHDELRVTVQAESGAEPVTLAVKPDPSAPLSFPLRIEAGKGFHTVTAELVRDGKPVRIYHSGFWMRDLGYLASG